MFLSGLSPMIEMEINFYHVFNILDFLMHCVTFRSNIKIYHECFFVPSQNLALDLLLFMLFVIVSSLVKKKKERNDQYDKVRLLDRWTEVGGQRVSCEQLQVSLLKSQRIISSDMRKKHPGFLLPMFRITGPYSGITVELRQI